MRNSHCVGVQAWMIAGMVWCCAGCYKEMPDQGRTGAPPPPTVATATPDAPAKPAQNNGTAQTLMNQPGSSALGAAKRSATNIVGQAEQQSQQTADQADDPLAKPAPKPE